MQGVDLRLCSEMAARSGDGLFDAQVNLFLSVILNLDDDDTQRSRNALNGASTILLGQLLFGQRSLSTPFHLLQHCSETRRMNSMTTKNGH